jgi:AcrR family transcriptional regulator
VVYDRAGAGSAAGGAGGAPAPPRYKPRASAKGEATRRRLVAAARQVLAEEDAGSFTTRNVAARSGLSHAMCHYHFADRTELLLAVIEDIRLGWVTPYREAVDRQGSFEELSGLVLELLTRPEGGELARVHSALHWFALSDDRIRDALQDVYAQWRSALTGLFQVLVDEQRAPADAAVLGTALACAVDGLAAIEALGANVDAPAVIAALMQALKESVTSAGKR